MTQTLTPVSTVAAGPWATTGAASAHAALADTSDATFIRATAAGVAELALAAGTAPATLTDHTVTFRASATGGAGVQAVLMQGATVIATDTVRYPGAAFSDFSFALTASQAGAITDRTNLRLRLIAVAPNAATTQALWTGLVTTSAITASVRLAGSGTASSARLVVSASPDLSAPAYSPAAAPDATFRIAKLTCTGLAADTVYHYGVEVDGALDAATKGQFRTLPAAANFSVVLGSCSNYLSTAAYAAINAISPKPAMFLQLGDMHYSDLTSSNEADRHAWFDSTFADPARHQTFRTIPTVYMWDDHDFGPDDSYGFASDGTTKSGYRDASIAAFRRRVPQPQANAAADASPYFSFVTGRLRWIISDCRSSRTVKSAPDNASKSVLGVTQKAWWKAEISAAAAAGQAVAWINSFPWVAAVEAGADHWGGYATERTELADHIKAAGMAGKVFILSGDMHALAIHSGADYATGGGAAIPVFHAGPLSMLSSSKGGPYTSGPFPPAGISVEVQQYGRLDLSDDGATLTVQFRGFSADGTLRMAHTITPLAPAAPAQPALVQHGINAQDSGTTTLTVSLPAPAAAGNYLIALVAPDKNAGTITQTAGSAMTKEVETLDAQLSTAIFTRRATGGEQSFTFAWTASVRPCISIIEFASVNATTPLDVPITKRVSAPGTTVNGLTAAAATPTRAGVLAVAWYAFDSQNSIANAADANWNEGFAQQFIRAGGTAANAGMSVATKALASTAAVAPAFSYSGTADEAMLHLILLRPA